MQESVSARGGFYIMRYEMSLSGAVAASKKDTTPANSGSSSTKYWYGLYKTAKTYRNGDVTSAMIANSQYDILLDWITSAEISEAGRNTSSKTGTNEKDKIRNIYDLNGGKWEWTTGAYETRMRVGRGGTYESTNKADNALANYPYLTGDARGTRSVLIW